MILIADGSHWKTFNIVSMLDANIGGVMWKATEGATFVDSTYPGVRRKCLDQNMPFMAMHYQNAGSSVQDEMENIRAHVSRDTALVLDVEKNSGDIMRTRDLYSRCVSAGYHVPFLYCPKWYWSSLGSPSLRNLPSLWASHYVSGSGDPRTLMRNVPVSWWEPYGENGPMLLQFTSSGRLPGTTVGDYSLFTGDQAQLRRFLDPNNFAYTSKEAETMLIPKGENASFPIAVPPSKQVDLVVAPGNSPVDVLHVYTWGDTPDQGTGYDAHFDVQVREFQSFPIPKGTGKVDLQYTAEEDFSVALDVRG